MDAPVSRHLPALDGVVKVDRVQTTDLDQRGQRRLDIAGLVGAPRLEDGLAPVPGPVEPETRVGARQDRFLEAGVPPGRPAVRRDLNALDSPATRPRQSRDLVAPRTRQPLVARGEGDNRLRLQDELELAGFPVRHEGGLPHAVHARQVGPVGHREAAQPLDVDVPRPAGHDEP